MEPHEIAAAIGVELVGRLPHGEGTGAFEVRRSDGSGAVMKLFTGDVLDLGVSTAITDALRARGYPIPAVHAAGEAHGVRYEIQDLAPGVPLDNLTRTHLGAVRALVDLQRDARPNGRGEWLDEMISSVVDGRVGYCEHAAMAAHSDDAASVEWFLGIGTALLTAVGCG